MIRDVIVVAIGNFMHEDNEFLDFCGLCAVLGLIALGVWI